MQILGDYKILKQIGQGALGIVLLAEHRFIKKQFALKILPIELCKEGSFKVRFEEEISKLAALDHPHIVKIHNVSEADGLYFLVTDCITGPDFEPLNLAQYRKGLKGVPGEEELFSIAYQIASALDYAHIKGQTTHQCLKLNNILVGKDPKTHIYISDFGISKILSAGKILCRTFQKVAEALEIVPEKEGALYPIESWDNQQISNLSQSFLQNFAFLAPEQKLFAPASLHADNYAFGILVYYLITGFFPEGLFALPSKFLPESHYDWDDLVTKCLRQDPLERPTKLCELFVEKRKPMLSEKLLSEKLEQRSFNKEEEKESSLSVEKLKERLTLDSLIPVEEMAMAESQKQTYQTAPSGQPELKPIIHPPSEKKSPTPTPSVKDPSFVESKDVSEATPRPINPPKEDYANTLSQMFTRDPVVTEYQPKRHEFTNIVPLYSEMSVIQGGDFFRGSNEGNRDEIPRHKVYVDSFAMDVHPVTNEQFVRFLDYMGGEKDANYHDIIRLKDSKINRSGGRLFIESGYGKHPVVGVTWYGAVAYAKWVGKRLPTEAEWEICSRGGQQDVLYPTGLSIEKSLANFFSSDTTPVMSYPPNGYGIYDMAGNIYEWCEDWYGYNYYETSAQEPHNPKGPLQGVYRVLRGGCWKSLREDLRSSHRHRNNPGTVNSTYGFRCAANVQ